METLIGVPAGALAGMVAPGTVQDPAPPTLMAPAPAPAAPVRGSFVGAALVDLVVVATAQGVLGADKLDKATLTAELIRRIGYAAGQTALNAARTERWVAEGRKAQGRRQSAASGAEG